MVRKQMAATQKVRSILYNEIYDLQTAWRRAKVFGLDWEDDIADLRGVLSDFTDILDQMDKELRYAEQNNPY